MGRPRTKCQTCKQSLLPKVGKSQKVDKIERVQLFYTISTRKYKTLAAAEKQLNAWEEQGTMNYDSRIFEVIGEVDWDVQPKIVVQR